PSGPQLETGVLHRVRDPAMPQVCKAHLHPGLVTVKICIQSGEFGVSCISPQPESSASKEHLMSKVSLDGNPIEIGGNFPQNGATAPGFTLTNQGLEEISLNSFAGKRKILNIIPSI